MRLYSEVETQQEICEVHSQAYAVGSGYLLVEFIELEYAARLVLVVADCPYVSGIDEYGSFKYPEKFGTVFDA